MISAALGLDQHALFGVVAGGQDQGPGGPVLVRGRGGGVGRGRGGAMPG